MYTRFLVCAVVLLIDVPSALADCQVLETSTKVPHYKCSTIEELEQLGNPDMFDVTIYNGLSPPIVSNATFERTPNLKITLLEDSLTGFSSDTLSTLKQFYRLLKNGDNNKLTILPSNMLLNLPLRYLHMNINSVRIMHPDAFKGLLRLEQLFIVNSRLEEIKNGTFNGLVVEILALSNNQIKTIEKNAFADMINLKDLRLNGNSLSEFKSEELITYTNKLETLLLNNNKLSTIDDNTLKGFNNLQDLNLGFNEIKYIYDAAFEQLSNLKILTLSHNLLYTINTEIFGKDGMPNLIKLNINNNLLSYLTPATLENFKEIKHIRLGGNPWKCSCLDEIIRWLGEHEVQQKCDKDYFSGIRPICVAVRTSNNVCDYSSDPSTYDKYRKVNNMVSINTECVS